MARGIRVRHHEVIISDHAWQRWLERSGMKVKRKKLARAVRRKLTGVIQGSGMYLDKTGAGWLEMFPWLWAAVRLTDHGWLVTTFINWNQKEEAG